MNRYKIYLLEIGIHIASMAPKKTLRWKTMVIEGMRIELKGYAIVCRDGELDYLNGSYF